MNKHIQIKSLILGLLLTGTNIPISSTSAQTSSQRFTCAPHLITFVVKPLDNRSGKGVRCVMFSEGRPGNSRIPKLAWYGEGNWGSGTYRHLGHAFYRGTSLMGAAADIHGNGSETINNNFPFGALKVTIVNPNTIRVTGAWNEVWTRVASADYSPLARPMKTCGPNLTEFKVSDLAERRSGKGLRCTLRSEHIPPELRDPRRPLVKGVTTWFGNGDWGESKNTYSHLGTFSLNGYGAGDICNSPFGPTCNTFGWGSLKFTTVPGGFNVTGAWNEKWRR